MQIDLMAMAPGPSIYYDPVFRNVLEDHMTFLREQSANNILTVDPSIAYKFEFDLDGLLIFYGVQPQNCFIVMRMNKMFASTDPFPENLSFMLPDQTTLEQIVQSHNTTRTIT